MENPSASTDTMLQIPEGVCVLTHDALCVNDIIQSVGDDRAGATAAFIGTTRNYFKGTFPELRTIHGELKNSMRRQSRDTLRLPGL